MKSVIFTLVTFFLFSISQAIRVQDFFPVESDNPQSSSNGPDSTTLLPHHRGIDFTISPNKIRDSDKVKQLKNRLNNQSPATPVRCHHANPVQLINLVKALRTGRPGGVDPAVFELLLSKKADDGPVTEVLKQILMRRFRAADVAGGDRLNRPFHRISGKRPHQLNDDRRVMIKEIETVGLKIRKFLAYF